MTNTRGSNQQLWHHSPVLHRCSQHLHFTVPPWRALQTPWAPQTRASTSCCFEGQPSSPVEQGLSPRQTAALGWGNTDVPTLCLPCLAWPHQDGGEKRGPPASPFPEQGVRGSGKCCGRAQTDPISRGWPGCHESRACRKITDNSFSASFCIHSNSLCCSTVCTSIFFSHSCQTTLIFSHLTWAGPANLLPQVKSQDCKEMTQVGWIIQFF